MNSYSTDRNINEEVIREAKESGLPVVLVGNKDSAYKVAIMLGIEYIEFYPKPELDKKEQETEAKELNLKNDTMYVVNNLDYLYNLANKNSSDFTLIRTEHYNYSLVLKNFTKENVKAYSDAGYDIR